MMKWNDGFIVVDRHSIRQIIALKDTVTLFFNTDQRIVFIAVKKIKYILFHQNINPPSKKFDGETLIFAPIVFLWYDLVIYFNVQQF